MEIFSQFIDDRDHAADAERSARKESGRSAANDQKTINWLSGNRSPEERLLSFDTWLRAELDTRLEWPKDEAKKARLIEQCRVQLEGLVLDLWKRGWYLDGKRLAAHLQSVLNSVGKYQRAGNVQDFWAYFKASVNRYVGVNAEEIHAEAMRAGSNMGQMLSAFGIKQGAKSVSLPELVAYRRDEISREQTLRQKLANQRKLAKKTGNQTGHQTDFL